MSGTSTKLWGQAKTIDKALKMAVELRAQRGGEENPKILMLLALLLQGALSMNDIKALKNWLNLQISGFEMAKNITELVANEGWEDEAAARDAKLGALKMALSELNEKEVAITLREATFWVRYAAYEEKTSQLRDTFNEKHRQLMAEFERHKREVQVEFEKQKGDLLTELFFDTK